MTYLLCDVDYHVQQQASFSNAARKAYTQVKKAQLLGGMDVVKPYDTKLVQALRKEKVKVAKSGKRSMLFGDVDSINNMINKITGGAKRSYTDAAQIARRGKTTPIKASTYIDRSGYIKNPQDNTVLTAAQKKVIEPTRRTNNEHAVILSKNKGKLKTSKLITGDSGSVDVPKGLISIHSHPINKNKKDIFKGAAAVIPSEDDLQIAKQYKTNLIVSPSPNQKKNTVTKYEPIDRSLQIDRYKPESHKGYRKTVREARGNYTVITPNKNQ